jgi:hypothetical protein
MHLQLLPTVAHVGAVAGLLRSTVLLQGQHKFDPHSLLNLVKGPANTINTLVCIRNI